jgi:Niemann-Pick C1 protein
MKQTNETFTEYIKDLCPHLYNPDSVGAIETCCDYKQLARFDKQFSVPRQLMTRCPACFLAFRTFLCDFTCSPKQAEFMVITDESNYNATVQQVKSVDYYATNSSVTDMYNACVDVQYPASNSKVMDLLCGTNVEDCSPIKFVTYLGTNDLAPFPFNTYLINGPLKLNDTLTIQPANSTMYGCGKPFSTKFMNASACGCSDCQDSCPIPQPPPPVYVCKIWGAECVSFICGMLFTLFVTVFVLTVLVGNVYLSRSRRSAEINPNDVEHQKDKTEEESVLIRSGEKTEKSSSCLNKIGVQTEAFLSRVFER